MTYLELTMSSSESIDHFDTSVNIETFCFPHEQITAEKLKFPIKGGEYAFDDTGEWGSVRQ